jgi:arsenate reductase
MGVESPNSSEKRERASVFMAAFCAGSSRPWRAPGHDPAMTDITIYHNPSCSTSRNVLAAIRESGREPQVVEYLKTPPTKEQLRALVAAMGVPVRAILREKEATYAQLGLADPKWSDEQLLDFIVQHPILLQRPVVVSPLGTKLCRPAEEVRTLLPPA